MWSIHIVHMSSKFLLGSIQIMSSVSGCASLGNIVIHADNLLHLPHTVGTFKQSICIIFSILTYLIPFVFVQMGYNIWASMRRYDISVFPLVLSPD